MDYEYVALTCDDISALAGAGPMFVAQFASLKTHGWELFVQAPWHTTGVLCRTGVVIMRRPKDEPRMWTEAQLRELMWGERERDLPPSASCAACGTHWFPPTNECPECGAKPRDCQPVLNERAMQADLCGRLERRNAELQEAIDEVVAISKQPRPHGAVRRLLHSLATKKEN